MPRAIGANCRLLMLPEDIYGTAPSDDFRRMPFLSCDLGAERPLLDADVFGLGSNRDPAALFLDTVTVQGQAVVPVDLVNIGHWLRLLLGPPITPGTSPNFIHSFGSGTCENADRRAGRRGGELRFPCRLQRHRHADDDSCAEEPAGRDGVCVRITR
jgi:hypothetical protein